jgi:4-amino-4-deoxy-L-arabinose transferase-like glycosyltransferase
MLRRLRIDRLLLAAFAIHLAVVLPLVWLLPAYIDEVYSLRTASHSVWESLKLGVTFERQAPMYFGMLNIWCRINNSIEFARIFSVLCTLGTIWVGANLSRQLFGRVPGATLALLLALHPSVLFAATECRVYAAEIFLVALLLYIFAKLFLLNQQSGAKLVALSVLAALSMYTQYHIGFLLLGLAVALLASGRLREARNFVACMVGTAILIIPILTWLTSQLQQPDGSTSNRFTAGETIRFAAGLVRTFLFPAAMHLVPSANNSSSGRCVSFGIQSIVVLLVFAAFWAIHKSGKAIRQSAAFFWCCLFVSMATLLAMAGAFGGRLLVLFPRYWVGLVMPSCLATLALLVDLGSRKVLVVSVLFYLTTNAGDAWSHYRSPAKYGDSIRVAKYIQENEAGGQPIVVFPNQHAAALSLYYHGPNPLVPLPKPVRFDKFDMRDDSMQSEAQITAALRQADGLERSLWLVFEPFDGGREAQFHPELVSAYFGRCYRTVKSRTFFNGLVVRQLVPMEFTSNCGQPGQY